MTGRNKLLIIIAFILIIGSIVYLYGTLYAAKNFKIKEYIIHSSNFNAENEGFTIVQISDIHYGTSVRKEELKKIINNINNNKPDIVVLTGDLLDNKISHDEHVELVQELKKINAKIGKYAVSGNHDTYYDNFNSLIDQAGFTNLDDTVTKIYYGNNNSILLSGIGDIIYSNIDIKERFETLVDSMTEEYISDVKYKILLMHEPDYVDEIDFNKFDMILSGHSHNGQVRIPFVGATYKPIGCKKYYKEHYNLNNTDLYISNGLGTTWIPIRLFNNPSYNVFRITNN